MAKINWRDKKAMAKRLREINSERDELLKRVDSDFFQGAFMVEEKARIKEISEEIAVWSPIVEKICPGFDWYNGE